MNIKDFESVFTHKQFEDIHDNLRAYLVNFGYLKIARADYGGGFYVYTDKQRAESGQERGTAIRKNFASSEQPSSSAASK